MWIIFALISAFSAATRRTSEKQLTQKLNHFTIGFATQLFSLPIIFLAVLCTGSFINPVSLGYQFWMPLIIVCVGFYPISSFLYLQSIKHAELSSVLPIQSLAPLFGLFISFITFRETPALLAIVAILFAVLGVYILGITGRTLHHPLRPFYEQTSSRYMLAAVALSTSVSVLDKVAVQASNALFYSLVSTAGASVVLAATMKLAGVREFALLGGHLKSFGLIGSLQGMSYSTFLLAIASGPIAYVAAIRSSNILLGALLGIALLKEQLTWQKILSSVLIAISIALFAFS